MRSEIVASREKVAKLQRQRGLAPEDNIFRGTPANLTILQKINKRRLAVFQTGRDAGNERIAVYELHSGGEGAIDPSEWARRVRRHIRHVEVGRHCARRHRTRRINLESIA